MLDSAGSTLVEWGRQQQHNVDHFVDANRYNNDNDNACHFVDIDGFDNCIINANNFVDIDDSFNDDNGCGNVIM